MDRLCGLVVRVPGYRSGGPGSIPGHYKKKKKNVVGLQRGSLSLVSTSLSLVSTTEELTKWYVQQRSSVFPVRYELNF
jgi:hypothetical protein